MVAFMPSGAKEKGKLRILFQFTENIKRIML